MGLKSATRRFAAWIACCAILFAALAPSISHALSVSRGETWTEICTVAGMKLVKVSADPSAPADDATAIHLEHCQFCATHPDSSALPPTAGQAIPIVITGPSHPFLFFQAPRPLAIWNAAQSRAPPSFS